MKEGQKKMWQTLASLVRKLDTPTGFWSALDLGERTSTKGGRKKLAFSWLLAHLALGSPALALGCSGSLALVLYMDGHTLWTSRCRAHQGLRPSMVGSCSWRQGPAMVHVFAWAPASGTL